MAVKCFLLVLQMSTEIANSFTSKDLAETFPRQVASLEYLLHEIILSRSLEVSVPTSDSDIVAAGNTAHVNMHVGLHLSSDNAAGSIGYEDDALTQLFGITAMDTSSSNYSVSYNGMKPPPTGFLFGDPLPWSLPFDGIAIVDKKDVDNYTDSQTLFQYQLDVDADSELLLTTQELELQFLTEDIFPAVEPFFV